MSDQTDIEDDDLLGKHPENEARAAETGGIAADRLRSIIERLERLAEEKAALARDMAEIFVEAKSAGFVCKAIRDLLKLRKMDAQERNEAEAILDLYRQALGL